MNHSNVDEKEVLMLQDEYHSLDFQIKGSKKKYLMDSQLAEERVTNLSSVSEKKINEL